MFAVWSCLVHHFRRAVSTLSVIALLARVYQRFDPPEVGDVPLVDAQGPPSTRAGERAHSAVKAGKDRVAHGA